MRLGFMTGCLPTLPLGQIVPWAAGHGYEALEVAAFPRRYAGMANHLDVADERAVDGVGELFAAHGVALSAVSYYDNVLHQDAKERALIAEHTRATVRAASALGCDLVGVLVGRDLRLTVAENLRLAEELWPPLVEYAAERGVRFVVENSPMLGWHPDTYPANLAYSPELWEWMFGLGLYLNWDPSHLQWMGIDPVAALRPYTDKVLHAQAKDVEIDRAALSRFGHFGQAIDRASDWESGWWRYRIPGRGEVDFRAIVDVLDEAGFEGVMAVEHEDPVWSGTIDRALDGLVIAERTLAPLMSGLNRRAVPGTASASSTQENR